MSTNFVKREAVDLEEKKTDWKFVIGTGVLLAVMILIASFFWRTVARQAAAVKEEEAREEASARSCIYMYYGRFYKKGVFVDKNTRETFVCEIPESGIYNKNGTLIPGDVLEEGDEVKIYGDNVLSGDIPSQYKNVKKIQRTGRATLEEAEPYRRITEELTNETEKAGNKEEAS